MRTYNEPIEVNVDAQGTRPHSFVWRGRRFVVNEVFSCWVERTPWWRLALQPHDVQQRGEERIGLVSQTPEPQNSELQSLELQSEVWRVEAVPGRSVPAAANAPVGVYDIVHHGHGWQMRRVLD